MARALAELRLYVIEPFVGFSLFFSLVLWLRSPDAFSRSWPIAVALGTTIGFVGMISYAAHRRAVRLGFRRCFL